MVAVVEVLHLVVELLEQVEQAAVATVRQALHQHQVHLILVVAVVVPKELAQLQVAQAVLVLSSFGMRFKENM
jgi:hypothetical protein